MVRNTPALMDDPAVWWASLNPALASQELALFAACAALAWALAWALRRATPNLQLSVLLGRKLLDGVLFPTLLLGLVFAARTFWAVKNPVWVFDFLVPVCLSLAVIRLGVQVLEVAFKEAAWVRPIERSLSWLAWGAVVLWLTGFDSVFDVGSVEPACSAGLAGNDSAVFVAAGSTGAGSSCCGG